jgi:hypothetical protein
LTVNGALRNWASWVYHGWDVNDPELQHSLTYAIAVDQLMRNLGWRERKAIAGKYLCELVHWRQSALVNAQRIVGRGLRKRKLIS